MKETARRLARLEQATGGDETPPRWVIMCDGDTPLEIVLPWRWTTADGGTTVCLAEGQTAAEVIADIEKWRNHGQFAG